MSPVSTICRTCHRIKPCGCPDREQARRHRNNVDLGRNTRHWRGVRLEAVQACHGQCPGCGTPERGTDPGSKLTCDLIGGGNHATATLDLVRVRCRRCHGTQDGGRHSLSRDRLTTRQPVASAGISGRPGGSRG